MSIKCPDTFDLLKEFQNLTEIEAELIQNLCFYADHREKLEDLIEANCPDTFRYARSCYSDPFDSAMWRRTLVLHAIDRILGTCGVEPIGDVDLHYGPPYEYLNAGDAYSTTLIFHRESDMLEIGCYGDIVERLETEHDE